MSKNQCVTYMTVCLSLICIPSFMWLWCYLFSRVFSCALIGKENDIARLGVLRLDNDELYDIDMMIDWILVWNKEKRADEEKGGRERKKERTQAIVNDRIDGIYV